MSNLTLFQDQLALSCNYNEKELAKEIRDGKWNKLNKFWLYPCTQSKLNHIKKLFPYIYVSSDVETKIKELEEVKKRALLFKKLDDYELDTNFLKTQPYKFQRAGIAFMLNQDCCMNFDDLGCGKTLQSIATAIIRKMQGSVKRCLIVCPVSMKHVWKQEIEKHSYEKAMVVEGNQKKRLKVYDDFKKSDYLFLILNYETLRIDIDILKGMYN
jgi:SNF2 family DNA or RNA helicase